MKHHHEPPTRSRHAARGPRHAQAPRVHRRVSGPAATSRTGAATHQRVPRPATTRPQAVPTPVIRGRTSEFARIALGGFLDRFLRGRGWICFVGAALGGIVFIQVWLLKLNTGISRAIQTTSTLERQNAGLEASIARLSAGDRIRRVAGGRGMVLPAAGAVGYVTVRGSYDTDKALERMRPPSDEARRLLALARTGDLTAFQATSTTALGTPFVDPTATTAPTTTTDPTATAATAPVAATDPTATATAPVVTDEATDTTTTAPVVPTVPTETAAPVEPTTTTVAPAPEPEVVEVAPTTTAGGATAPVGG